MNSKQTDLIDRYIYLINVILLITHIFLLLTFYYFHVTILFRYNIFSLLFYLCCFLILRLKGKKLFLCLAYIEIFLHMLLATTLIGMNSGFQIYLFVLIAISFYIDYLDFKDSNHPQRRMALINLFLIPAFLVGELLYFQDKKPSYPMTRADTIMILSNVNLLLVFFALFFFLFNYSEKVMQSEILLKKEAQRDYLTGMYNRLYMMPKIEHLNLKKHRYWIAILDIDNFKLINDKYGHDCGDYVLKNIAAMIRSHIASYDACRWGGEEFLLLGKLPEAGNGQVGLLEELRREIKNKEFTYDNQKIRVTATIGTAVYEESMSKNDWIRAADDFLYQGKQNGKNRVISQGFTKNE